MGSQELRRAESLWGLVVQACCQACLNGRFRVSEPAGVDGMRWGNWHQPSEGTIVKSEMKIRPK